MGRGHGTSQAGEGAVNLPVPEASAAERAPRGIVVTFAAAVVSVEFYIFTS